MCCDPVQPKLVRIAADELAESLTCIINSAVTQSIFSSKYK